GDDRRRRTFPRGVARGGGTGATATGTGAHASTGGPGVSTIVNLALYLLEPEEDDLLVSLASGESFHRSHLRSAAAWLSEAFRGQGLNGTRVGIDLSPA